MTRFPSAEWFDETGRRLAQDGERLKRLGYVEANVGVTIADGDRRVSYVLEFAGYGLRRAREAADPAFETDFAIEGGIEDWREMIENIRAHGGSDLAHTLNRLTMAGTPLKVTAADQLRQDLFFRFNQSLQAYFDASAAVDTEFLALSAA